MLYLAASSLLHIDAQKDPLPAVFVAALVCILLYVLVGLTKRRENRRRSRRDLSGWRSRIPPE